MNYKKNTSSLLIGKTKIKDFFFKKTKKKIRRKNEGTQKNKLQNEMVLTIMITSTPIEYNYYFQSYI